MLIPFDELFEDKTKFGTKLKTDAYHNCGTHIIVDQGHDLIAGYTDSEEGIFSEIPVIIFGDHTRIVKYIDEPFFLGADGVKVFRCKDNNANYKYLYYALKSVHIPNTGYNRHFKWLKAAQIPYPDSSTQAVIVDVLDRTTSVIEKRKQEIKLLDNLIKARFVEMFGDVQNEMQLSEVCSIITDGTHQPPKFVSEGIPFIFVSNITGNKVTYEAEKFIDQSTYDELIKRTPIEVGDVLLSTVGSYGHPAVVKTGQKFLFQRHIAYLKPRKNLVDSDYLHGAILSPNAQRQIEEGVKGVAQKTLNLSEIKKITIPVPDLKRQKQFAAFVAQVDKSKFAVQKALEETQTLFDSLMQQYFG